MLAHRAVERGRPARPRPDNGSEFTSRRFLARCEREWIAAEHAEPGKPRQNAHIEGFDGRLRDERLNAELFRSVAEARAATAEWRHRCNQQRPHSALGYHRLAAARLSSGSATPRLPEAARLPVNDFSQSPLRKEVKSYASRDQ